MGARMASIRALVVPLVVWAVFLLLVLEASVNQLKESSSKLSLSQLRDREEMWEEGEEEVDELRTAIATSTSSTSASTTKTTNNNNDSDSVTAVVVGTAARRLYSSSRLMIRRIGGKMRLRARRVLKEIKPYTTEARVRLRGSSRIQRGNINSSSRKMRSPSSLSSCGNGCSPPPEPELDPRFGVEKRLVPTGPNPLHN